VLILPHNNPDPDALSSGKALAWLLQTTWGISSRLVYSGLVARAENRVMLDTLTPEWEYLERLPDPESYSSLALVDSQPGAGNNNLPEEIVPQIVFDHHHPRREALERVPFAAVDPDAGATVTLVYQYLKEAGLTPDPKLATAMFYGIKTDTRGLSRGASPQDKTAYIELLALLDRDSLTRVEQAELPRIYFNALSGGLHRSRIYGQCVITQLGDMHRPDLAAEIADLLIRLEKTRAVLCLGYHGEMLHLSMRTKNLFQDAGLLIQRIILPPGKAGGHGSSAGGQVRINPDQVAGLIRKIKKRYLQVMGETDSQGASLLEPHA
jgi:nanoRNase/pAp phosphatase (c-di-AMP/oligoRNAs hydrolase)